MPVPLFPYRRCFLFIAAIGACLCAPPGWCDRIYLVNGDRVSGVIAHRDEEKVLIETEYAGTLSIPRTQIDVLEAEDTLFGLAEETRAEEDTNEEKNRWGGSVDSGLSIRQGETDTFDANAALRFVRTMPRHILTLGVVAAYGEVDSKLNTQRASGEAKWRYFQSGRSYYFTVLALEHDKSRRLELRATGGGGVGYEFIQRPERKLHGEAGLQYARERWKNFGAGGKNAVRDRTRLTALAQFQQFVADLTLGSLAPDLFALLQGASIVVVGLEPGLLPGIRTENHIILRLSAGYEQHLFGESHLNEKMALLPNLDEWGEYRLTNNLVFTTPLTDRLNLRISLKTEYDSDPGNGAIDKFDNTLITGVSWKF